MATDHPMVDIDGISKFYGKVAALKDVSFTINSGEAVALVGDNGAGKSTLVDCLSGATKPDGGAIRLDGVHATTLDTTTALDWGVETVYQGLALANDLEPALNVYLGRELKRPGLLGRLGMLDRRLMRQRTRDALDEFGVGLSNAQRPVAYMSGGQRQAVAIARAGMWAKRLVLLDEPTAALGVKQSAIVLNIIRQLKSRGIAVMVISHNLHEVFSVSDRIVVLRQGRVANVFTTKEATTEQVVSAITGADLVERAES